MTFKLRFNRNGLSFDYRINALFDGRIKTDYHTSGMIARPQAIR
jgi:hypothetical protein